MVSIEEDVSLDQMMRKRLIKKSQDDMLSSVSDCEEEE